MTMNNSNMNKTDNRTCVNIGANPISDFLIAIYSLAFVLGLAFNLFTLCPIIQQIRSKNVLGVYLLNLLVSDMLYIVTMPMWIYYYYQDHRWKLSPQSCELAGFLYYSNMYISIYLLCCISIDRCLTVTYPLWVKTLRRSRCAWGICAAVSILIMTMHVMVLYLDQLEDPLDRAKERCYETYPMTERVALFNLLRVGLFFLVPLLILVACYWQILAKVRRSTGLDEKAKRKVKLLSVGVILIFSICFAPYHILLAVRSTAFSLMDKERNCAFEQNLHFFFSCTLALSSLNSVVDPLLYVLVSNGVREDMRLCCWRVRHAQCQAQRSQETGSTVTSSKWRTRVTSLS